MADELTLMAQGRLAQAERTHLALTVGMLERRLGARFPEEDGEAWDTYGMTVGDPDAPVNTVAVALDATVSAIRMAAELGADVLVTHHPLFMEPPERISPSPESGSGRAVWEAMAAGVAVMSFHTALDAQPAAGNLMPDMLGLETLEVFKPLGDSEDGKGYGRICAPREDDALTLGTLAGRCTSIFGIQPRVWGNFAAPVRRIVTWGGSLGHAFEPADLSRADTVICGEVKYHEALALAEAGVSVIELGHDASELPLTLLLARAVQEAGVDKAAIHLVDRGVRWAYPETIRV